ncbi:MAG: hypothetical protein LBD79_10435 [Treponema sp.]|jgi:hypothetical protein|nr:hypothetical protein [Treponema sp.]
MKKSVPVLILALCFSGTLSAIDTRTIPLDLFLIIDDSSLLAAAKDTATVWMCNHLIDELLQDGDHLTIWLTSDTARIVFSDSVDRVRKETAKNMLHTMADSSAPADFAGALRAASVRAGAIQNTNRIVYTLLVSGSEASIFSTTDTDIVGLLRVSRVDDFSGWRVLTIGLGLSSQAQRAASNYIKGDL